MPSSHDHKRLIRPTPVIDEADSSSTQNGSAGPSLISDQPARSGRIEGRLPPLIVLPAVPVISSIAAVPIIFAGFGSPAMAVLVLFLPRPTLSAAGLIRPTGLILAAGLILTTPPYIVYYD